jgi:hypothetical protein
MSSKLFNISGLQVHIHGLDTLRPDIPVTVLFLLHGRLGSQADFSDGSSLGDLSRVNERPNLKRQLCLLTRHWTDVDWFVRLI